MRPDFRSPLRRRLYEVIFETDTPAGRHFDVALLVAILASVAVVMLDSVAAVRAGHGELLRVLEWGFTLLFTVEYALRLWVAPRPGHYARSFFGVVDLLAVLPTYLSVLLPGGQFFVVVRMLRVIRVFRILKLVHFVGEGAILAAALKASRHKIAVFLVTVLSSVVIVGALMYLIEGADAGFTSIPTSVYWAIVTLTTVGYGDISPTSPVGQLLASVVMILGYAIIAVPTGIVTVELGREAERERVRQSGAGGGGGVGGAVARGGVATAGGEGVLLSPAAVESLACPACGATDHAVDAAFCRRCGAALGAGEPRGQG